MAGLLVVLVVVAVAVAQRDVAQLHGWDLDPPAWLLRLEPGYGLDGQICPYQLCCSLNST